MKISWGLVHYLQPTKDTTKYKISIYIKKSVPNIHVSNNKN